MDRYRYPLLLGLAGVVVYVGSRWLFEVSRVTMDGLALSGGLVYVPGLAFLGYLAGQRRSVLGLLAVIVGYLAALIVTWIALAG
jgi:hypothetical protein